jgi:hypothetical protein
MNRLKVPIIVATIVTSTFASAFLMREAKNIEKKKEQSSIVTKGCVFMTLFREDADSGIVYTAPVEVVSSMEKGLSWLIGAQQADGGWGAGSHSRQNELDPHSVKTDPATTAMVGMAIMRSGSTLSSGKYSTLLNKSLMYMLQAVEKSPSNSSNITSETGTQIQTKLGANIDVILGAQFLSNILDQINNDQALKARVKNCLNICVTKIQKTQSGNGSFSGSGWAGVLQSSFANNALESAQKQGAAVDTAVLERSRDFQKGNYNAETGDVRTDMGAGVVLYSVSSSTRASAKEARKVDEDMAKAKKEGKIAANAPASAENLQKIGYDKTNALRYSTSYNVYQSGKVTAQDDKVLNGFGNNGGEEFLSYLQTGESMIINKDDTWKKWYDNTSGKLLSIQNNDGSWNGHHCITSPVFCTATCLLILSVNNDVEKLNELGKE